jgi:hypothetical protein
MLFSALLSLFKGLLITILHAKVVLRCDGSVGIVGLREEARLWWGNEAVVLGVEAFVHHIGGTSSDYLASAIAEEHGTTIS